MEPFKWTNESGMGLTTIVALAETYVSSFYSWQQGGTFRQQKVAPCCFGRNAPLGSLQT